MKSILLSLLMLITVNAFSQTADEIINKHIEAIGGLSNWKKINSSYSEMSVDMGGVKMPIKIWQIHMKAMRAEFEVQGMTGIQVVTDKDGWSLMPFMGKADPEPTNEEALKASQAQLDIHGQLVDYAAKGSTVEYLGEDEEEGVEVYKIRLTDKDKTETTYFIDKSTNFIIKSVSKAMFQGKEIESPTVFSNYKKVGDIMFPHSINSQMGPMEVVKMEVNVKVDEAIFKMPTK